MLAWLWGDSFFSVSKAQHQAASGHSVSKSHVNAKSVVIARGPSQSSVVSPPIRCVGSRGGTKDFVLSPMSTHSLVRQLHRGDSALLLRLFRSHDWLLSRFLADIPPGQSAHLLFSRFLSFRFAVRRASRRPNRAPYVVPDPSRSEIGGLGNRPSLRP